MALQHIYIVNVVPSSNLLSTQTSPPMFSMSYLLILSPRPVPCLLIAEESSSFEKSRKSFDRSSHLMPIPLSMMSILKVINFSSVKLSISGSKCYWYSLRLIIIFTLLCLWLNLTAFERKFRNIYMYRFWSPSMLLNRSISSSSLIRCMILESIWPCPSSLLLMSLY